MKMTRIPEAGCAVKGLQAPPQVVNMGSVTKACRFWEDKMNLNAITTLIAFGLGILVFLSYRIRFRLVRQPILVENRRILYKRERG